MYPPWKAFRSCSRSPTRYRDPEHVVVCFNDCRQCHFHQGYCTNGPGVKIDCKEHPSDHALHGQTASYQLTYCLASVLDGQKSKCTISDDLKIEVSRYEQLANGLLLVVLKAGECRMSSKAYWGGPKQLSTSRLPSDRCMPAPLCTARCLWEGNARTPQWVRL